MRLMIFAAALSLTAPALADPAAAPIRVGATVRTSDMARVGQVDRVNADGSIQIIYRAKFVTLPAGTLTVSNDRGITTSLTKKEVNKL